MLRKGGVADLGRDAGGAVGRPEHAGDEARTARRRSGVADLAAQPGAFVVQFADQVFEAVIGLGAFGRGEGVGFEEVDAGGEILVADVADDVGARQGEEVVVALELAAVVAEACPAEIVLGQLEALDQHAPGTVEQENALAGFLRHPLDAGGAVETHAVSFSSRAFAGEVSSGVVRGVRDIWAPPVWGGSPLHPFGSPLPRMRGRKRAVRAFIGPRPSGADP